MIDKLKFLAVTIWDNKPIDLFFTAIVTPLTGILLIRSLVFLQPMIEAFLGLVFIFYMSFALGKLLYLAYKRIRDYISLSSMMSWYE
jgi:hypothetical protein